MVRQTPTMTVSIQRVSGVPRAAIRKLAKPENDQTERSNSNRERDDRKRDEQRAAPVIGCQRRTVGGQSHHRYGRAKPEQQHGEHARRGSRAERKAMHALQIARCPQGEQRDRHQGYSAEEILRCAYPFRQDRTGRPVASTFHSSPSVPSPTRAPVFRGRDAVISRIRGFFVHSVRSAKLPLPQLAYRFSSDCASKTQTPPASNNQSGLSLVAAATAAAATVISMAGQLRSVACATISPLAAISPIDSGTSAAWIVAGQCDWLRRASERLRNKPARRSEYTSQRLQRARQQHPRQRSRSGSRSARSALATVGTSRTRRRTACRSSSVEPRPRCDASPERGIGAAHREQRHHGEGPDQASIGLGSGVTWASFALRRRSRC